MDQRYRIVLDPAAAPVPGHRLEVPRDTSVGAVAAALRVVFERHPDLDGVDLVVGGTPAGTAGRARVRSLLDAGGQVRGETPLGAGDDAALPGPPTTFTVFAFRCPACGETAYRIAADEAAPDCRTAGHGRMEHAG
jgi:hypothetical protein